MWVLFNISCQINSGMQFRLPLSVVGSICLIDVVRLMNNLNYYDKWLIDARSVVK